jgi:hypothetical protein
VFDGSDIATRERRFEEHQRQEVPCQLKPKVIKEGISEAQWAALGKSSNKKGKSTSCPLPRNTVEKWNEIWVVLFPAVNCPSNPCKLNSLKNAFPILIIEGHPRDDMQIQFPVPGESQVGYFKKLLEVGLQRMVNTQNIRLDDVDVSRVVDVATQTFVLVHSPPIQDLSLGSVSSIQHPSDYSSFLEGSYLEVTSSAGIMGAGDPTTNRDLSHIPDDRRLSAPSITHKQHTSGSPVANMEPVFPQRIDHNVLPPHTMNPGGMDHFSGFPTSSAVQPDASGQYQPFGSPSFYPLPQNVNYQMDLEGFYHPAPQSFGNGNEGNAAQILYPNNTAINPPTTTQYNTPCDFRHSPRDARR